MKPNTIIAYGIMVFIAVILIVAAYSLFFGPKNIIDGGPITVGPKCDGTIVGALGCSE